MCKWDCSHCSWYVVTWWIAVLENLPIEILMMCTKFILNWIMILLESLTSQACNRLYRCIVKPWKMEDYVCYSSITLRMENGGCTYSVKNMPTNGTPLVISTVTAQGSHESILLFEKESWYLVVYSPAQTIICMLCYRAKCYMSTFAKHLLQGKAVHWQCTKCILAWDP